MISILAIAPMNIQINLLQRWQLLTISMLMGMAIPVMAQTYTSKYAGNSKSWRPDYAGTIQIQASGSQNFTAVMDVELQLKPDSDPNPTRLKYELRGQMSFTSPIVTKIVNEKGASTSTCTPISPVPLNIAESGMNLYRGEKGNRYEIKAYQYIRDSKCVLSHGGNVYQTGESKAGSSIGFDSSRRAMTAADRNMAAEAKDFNISDADRQKIETSGRAIVNNPALQQEMAKIQQEEAEFQRTGKKPNQAAQIARMQKLIKSGALPASGGLSSLSPEFQQRVGKITPLAKKVSEEDDAKLIKATDLNRLQGSSSYETGVENYNTKQEATWDLRRVNSNTSDRQPSLQPSSKPSRQPGGF